MGRVHLLQKTQMLITWLTVKACSCEVHRVHTSSAFSFKVRLCVPKNKRTHSSPVTRWSDNSTNCCSLCDNSRPGPSLSTPGPVGKVTALASAGGGTAKRRLVKQTEWTVLVNYVIWWLVKQTEWTGLFNYIIWWLVKQTEWTVLFNYIIWWLVKQTQTELVVWRLVRQTQTELCYLTE